MPIYEYECASCHHRFDFIQKINEPPVTVCPECSKTTLVKLVSAPGFQLKGTGWYATDFKDKTKTTKKEEASTSKDDSTSTSTNKDSSSADKSS